jgi:hypothetical protein
MGRSASPNPILRMEKGEKSDLYFYFFFGLRRKNYYNNTLSS